VSKANKAPIIKIIFDRLWNERDGAFSRSEVTLDDVQSAIRHHNANNPNAKAVSDRNPANFFKDFTRRRASANQQWPAEIFAKRFSGRQLVGEGKCFEFVPIVPGQLEPFPSKIPGPSVNTPVHSISSLVLPLASLRLGRADEPWLIQVAVRLRVVESHMALFSPLASSIAVVDHLQNSIKLRKSEIDALFLALVSDTNNKLSDLLITCEVKREREDVLMEQILRQPRAIFGALPDIHCVLPLSIHSIGSSRLHLTEFDVVTREELDLIDELPIIKDVIYELRPAVPGIGGGLQRRKSRKSQLPISAVSKTQA